MIIVDTCIIVYLFNESDLTHFAFEVLDIDPHWFVPTLWQEEYANLIAKTAKLLKVADNEVVDNFLKTFEQIQPRSKKVDVIEALKLSLKMDISVYDAHFIVLAAEMNTHLITEDRELIKKCPDIAISLKNYIKLHKH